MSVQDNVMALGWVTGRHNGSHMHLVGGGGGGSCFIIGTSVTGDGWRETLIMSPDPGLHIVPHLSVQWH